MVGMRVLEMELCDALDVIHVLMEEDFMTTSQHEHDEKQRIRGIIYNSIYEVKNSPYKDPDTSTSTSAYATADGASAEMTAQTKPYIPVTDPMKLDSVLGPPLE